MNRFLCEEAYNFGFRDELEKISGINKSASWLKSKSGDSTILGDFVAGVDPTGVQTFKNATNNKKNHLMHQAVGNVGGFLGGAAISTGLAATGALTLGWGLGKKFPVLGKTLRDAGKTQFSIFNPASTWQTVKRVPQAINIASRQGAIFKDVTNAYSKSQGGQIVNNIVGKSNPKSQFQNAKKVMDDALNYKKKYGEDPVNTVEKGVALIGGVTSGVLGGGLNALSSQMQYSSALKRKKQGLSAATPVNG
jgi:hypothetical protein